MIHTRKGRYSIQAEDGTFLLKEDGTIREFNNDYEAIGVIEDLPADVEYTLHPPMHVFKKKASVTV